MSNDSDPLPSAIEIGSMRASKRLLDSTAAAELLGVPKTWVLAEARANRIPHIRLGRYVRYEATQLEAWWQARRRGPAPRRGQHA